MKLTLKRTFKGPNYTIGHLYINDKYFCDTIEDVYRGTTDDMLFIYEGIGYWKDKDGHRINKVYGETAIPNGTYEFEVTHSPKFGLRLPILKNVKGFEGIRIHSGNTEKDSLGCIIVGENKVKGKVINSKITLTKLMSRIEEAIAFNEKLEILITN